MRSADSRPATHCRRAPSRRCRSPPWWRAGGGAGLLSTSLASAWRPLFGRAARRAVDAVVAPRGLGRDEALGEIVGDRVAIARPRGAPAAAAGRAAGDA